MGYAMPKNRELFISHKAAGIALPASGLARDLLVQQTLDPRVRSIGVLRFKGDEGELSAYLVQRDDGFYVLDFSPSGSPHGQNFARIAASFGHRTLHVDASDIMEEPRCSTARNIWTHRFTPVPAAMRIAITSYLDDQGPLRLDELCLAVPGPLEPVGVLLAMLCRGDLELVDELTTITPDTKLRRRA